MIITIKRSRLLTLPRSRKSESTKNEKLYSKHDLVLQMRIWQELHTTERVDRRFDSKIPGLCIHLRPSGVKTFYAYKSVNMYNKKQNKWAPNVVYKKCSIGQRILV